MNRNAGVSLRHCQTKKKLAMKITDIELRIASQFLSDGEHSVKEQLEAIYEQVKVDKTEMVDYIENVQPKAQYEFTFSAETFTEMLDNIGLPFTLKKDVAKDAKIKDGGNLSLNDLLELWEVHGAGMWDNEVSQSLDGWSAVSNENGIVAYFATEKEAYRYRLDKINQILNG